MTDQEIQAKGEELDKAIAFVERLLAMEKTTAELAEAKSLIETLKAKVKSAEFLCKQNLELQKQLKDLWTEFRDLQEKWQYVSNKNLEYMGQVGELKAKLSEAEARASFYFDDAVKLRKRVEEVKK